MVITVWNNRAHNIQGPYTSSEIRLTKSVARRKI